MPDTDLLVIGGGIMGAIVARQVRAARGDRRITIVDAGAPIGRVPGRHLHDVDDPALWSAYNQAVTAGVQSAYAGAATRAHVAESVRDVDPGVYFLSEFREDSAAMPGAALAWNAGGMGVHWTAATPWPYGTEVPSSVPSEVWAADLAAAQTALQVHPCPYGVSPEGDKVLAAMASLFGPLSDPGRDPQAMPMSLIPTRERNIRVGPSRILPALHQGSDPALTYLTGTLCSRILHDGSRATGAGLRNVRTGEEFELTARQVVICADAIRTPQLLWASGVRPVALGRNLNEHAFLSGRVVVDLDRLEIDVTTIAAPRPRETVTGSYWVPFSGPRQPTCGQVMTSPILAEDLRTPVGLMAVLSWYVPFGNHEGSRLEFSDTETDLAGLPRITTRFERSEEDEAALEAGRATQATAGSRLGDFDPAIDSGVLPAGSSLHYTGTVRMGVVDDGTSVCDTNGRVWRFDNLFVAGNGVVPTAIAANVTLTGAVTAVRAARAITEE